MRELDSLVRRLARSAEPVLITGESGVGKERVARELHARSAAGSGPFVSENCAAVAEGVATLALALAAGVDKKGSLTAAGSSCATSSAAGLERPIVTASPENTPTPSTQVTASPKGNFFLGRGRRTVERLRLRGAFPVLV